MFPQVLSIYSSYNRGSYISYMHEFEVRYNSLLGRYKFEIKTPQTTNSIILKSVYMFVWQHSLSANQTSYTILDMMHCWPGV